MRIRIQAYACRTALLVHIGQGLARLLQLGLCSTYAYTLLLMAYRSSHQKYSQLLYRSTVMSMVHEAYGETSLSTSMTL